MFGSCNFSIPSLNRRCSDHSGHKLKSDIRTEKPSELQLSSILFSFHYFSFNFLNSSVILDMKLEFHRELWKCKINITLSINCNSMFICQIIIERFIICGLLWEGIISRSFNIVWSQYHYGNNSWMSKKSKNNWCDLIFPSFHEAMFQAWFGFRTSEHVHLRNIPKGT